MTAHEVVPSYDDAYAFRNLPNGAQSSKDREPSADRGDQTVVEEGEASNGVHRRTLERSPPSCSRRSTAGLGQAAESEPDFLAGAAFVVVVDESLVLFDADLSDDVVAVEVELDFDLLSLT